MGHRALVDAIACRPQRRRADHRASTPRAAIRTARRRSATSIPPRSSRRSSFGASTRSAASRSPARACCSTTPATRQRRRHRHRARHLHRRARQPRRVSGRPDRARADRRAGDSLQQHRLERAGQPVRDRVRAARPERHVQPAGGVEPRRARLQRRRDPRGTHARDGHRRRRLRRRDVLQGPRSVPRAVADAWRSQTAPRRHVRSIATATASF